METDRPTRRRRPAARSVRHACGGAWADRARRSRSDQRQPARRLGRRFLRAGTEPRTSPGATGRRRPLRPRASAPAAVRRRSAANRQDQRLPRPRARILPALAGAPQPLCADLSRHAPRRSRPPRRAGTALFERVAGGAMVDPPHLGRADRRYRACRQGAAGAAGARLPAHPGLGRRAPDRSRVDAGLSRRGLRGVDGAGRERTRARLSRRPRQDRRARDQPVAGGCRQAPRSAP